jgi:mono/diheme cytochrome c family protein
MNRTDGIGGIILALLLGGTTLLPAWPWSRDMMIQPSIDPLEENFPIPKGIRHLESRIRTADRMDAHTRIHNPLPADSNVVATGDRFFGLYCTPCHGPGGEGDGPVTEKFIPPPPLFPLVDDRSDGYLYGTLRFGGSIMPPYGDELRDTEIWSIVHYLRRESERSIDTKNE